MRDAGRRPKGRLLYWYWAVVMTAGFWLPRLDFRLRRKVERIQPWLRTPCISRTELRRRGR
jgi:hypothetical protein